MSLPKLSPLTKTQIISIVKNALIAGLSAGLPFLLSGQYNVAESTAVAAIIKTIEKAFTKA